MKAILKLTLVHKSIIDNGYQYLTCALWVLIVSYFLRMIVLLVSCELIGQIFLDDTSYSSQTENLQVEEIFIFPRFTSSLYLTYFPCGSMCSPRPTGHIHWGCLAKKALQDSHIQHPAFKLHSASSWYFSNIWKYAKYTLTFFFLVLEAFFLFTFFFYNHMFSSCKMGNAPGKTKPKILI